MTRLSSCKRDLAFSLLAAITLLVSLSASAQWNEKVLHDFQAIPDGSQPAGGVIFDSAGNLYGTTYDGGAEGCHIACGTVFQLQPQGGGVWTENILYVFKGNDGNDGELPAGGLISDQLGNLYGVTAYGGSGDCNLLGIVVGCGTVFEMSPPAQAGGAWTETVLYSFQGRSDGYLPTGDLTFDRQGKLFGATQFGGGDGSCDAPYYQACGTVFGLSPPKMKGGTWAEEVLYSFKGIPQGLQVGDGASPNGGLLLDNEGAIYGTTYHGGDNYLQQGDCIQGGETGCGTVFELTPPQGNGGKWTESLLHVFTYLEDGYFPAAGLTFDGNGYLYGTTQSTAFRLDPISEESDRWSETILYTFDADVFNPNAALILDKAGNLYGTSEAGGCHQGCHGSVYRLNRPEKKGEAWTLTILYAFLGPPGDGGDPAASLVYKDGSLYSTTQMGGIQGDCPGGLEGCGSVFEISP